MNKMTISVMAVAALVIGLIAFSWISMDTKAPANAPAVPQETAAAPMPDHIAPSAGTAATAPVVATPTASVPTPPVATVPATSPVVAAPVTKTTPADSAPVVLDETMHTELKTVVENNFQEKLTFPLNEDKMVAFAKAALRIEKINQKWDVQIASAETDAMAIEYNNFAVEEISNTMQSMQGINVAEFNELTQLTARDMEFNKVYQAYKQLVEEGALTVKPSAPRVPAVALPPETTPATTEAAPTPASAPVNPGTAPAPRG
jgi:hypothetical protein